MAARATEFTGEEYGEAYPAGVENTYWHLARGRILERQLRAAGSTRVLDVGCGRGILVKYLNDQGIDCYGVELAEVEVPESLRERIITGMAAENLSADLRATVDTIVLGDVIEHLADPVTFLRGLPLAFPRLRALLVAVPARSELWSNYDEHYGHYRRYDLATLSKTIEAAGFAVSELRYMFRLLYLPARILLALRGSREISIQPAGSRSVFHRLVATLIAMEFAFLPKRVYGTSAICRAVLPDRAALAE